MIIRGKAKKETLEHIVKVINSIIKNEDCYYTKDELKEALHCGKTLKTMRDYIK